MRPVAVLGVGSAAPSLRLASADVGAAWGSGGGRGVVGLCDADEDTLTLAWQAATAALDAAGIAAGDVSGLWWGTTRPPFAEGPSHVFLATTLGLGTGIEGALVSGSTHAGMEALVAAWDALASGHARVAVVVASDALVPGLGTAGEATTGAGAAALVLGVAADTTGNAATIGNGAAAGNGVGAGPTTDASPAARLTARATRSMPAVDRYRADADAATGDVYDGRLFREEVFVPLLTEAGRAAVGASAAPVEAWALADPDGKLAAAVAKRLGAPLASAPVHGALGDTGAAAALLGLVQACADSPPGDSRTVGAIGYGGGRATAVTVEALRPVPGALGVSALGPGRRVTYTEAVKARGQLEPMSDPIAMGLPPGGAAFVRGNTEMLALLGARCRACGTISTPPSIHPTCTGCGRAELDVVPLARRGTVQTFVVNQTMPPPFQAPLPLVVVDLDDGARLMVQGVSADARDLAVGDVVTLSLRLYAMERGIPVYGYKAFREAGTTGSTGSTGATGTATAAAAAVGTTGAVGGEAGREGR